MAEHSRPEFDYSVAGKRRLTADEAKLVRLMERAMELAGRVYGFDRDFDDAFMAVMNQQGRISARREFGCELRVARAVAAQTTKSRRTGTREARA